MGELLIGVTHQVNDWEASQLATHPRMKIREIKFEDYLHKIGYFEGW